MKKKMIALLAAAMLTLAAGSAFADFAANDLIRVVYNTTTNTETATDLGSLTSLLAVNSPTVVGSGATAFTTVAGVSGATNLAGDQVAYFAVNSAGTGFYVSGIPSNVPVANPAQTAGTNGWMTSTNNNYASLSGGTGIATTAITNTTTKLSVPNTYYLNGDKSGNSIGAMGSLLLSASWAGTEASLASLATPGSSVSQALYLLTSTSRSGNTTGLEELVLITNANGSTTIEAVPAATPIPPSFFLMGSGLLGMFGLRRKQRA